jgi:hypothetical protein
MLGSIATFDYHRIAEPYRHVGCGESNSDFEATLVRMTRRLRRFANMR